MSASPSRVFRWASVALAVTPLILACAHGAFPLVGTANGSDKCPAGLRARVVPSLGVAECVDAAAADFDVCVASLGLNVPRASPSGSVVIDMPFAKAGVSSVGSANASGNNAQVFFEAGGEIDRARADALRACTQAFRRAAGLSSSASAPKPPPTAPSSS